MQEYKKVRVHLTFEKGPRYSIKKGNYPMGKFNRIPLIRKNDIND